MSFFASILIASVIVGDPAYTVFFRNQENAAVHIPVKAEKRLSGTISGLVGAVACPPRAVTVRPAGSFADLAFDPALFSPGEYPWRAEMCTPEGERLFVREGKLRILPRRERDTFVTLSWGGWSSLPPEYLAEHGLDSVNLPPGALLKPYIDAGMFVNIRLENSKTPAVSENFDLRAAAADAYTKLSPYAGLHTWNTTLVNSEVYGGSLYQTATNMPAWCAMAEKELGFKPDFTMRTGPFELDYQALGIKPYLGVLPSDRTYESAAWFVDHGMPVIRVNAVLCRLIHRLSPGNIVWTEPPYAGCGHFAAVDMGASWIYDYPTATCLSNFRRLWANARSVGRRAMPTIANGYWHRRIPRAQHPSATDKRTGQPLRVRLGQSADELMAKSWMAVAAAPANALSYFSADTWMLGESNAVKYARDPSYPAKIIAEPGSTARYGAFMRDTFRPAAELLRNMTNAPAAFAVAMPLERSLAGGFRWQLSNYTQYLSEMLGESPVAYDFIQERELTLETLSRYRYVMIPMLRVVTQKHDEIFREAARKGVKLVVDEYCQTEYPGMVRLPMSFIPPRDPSATPVHPKLRMAFESWFAGQIPFLRATMDARSDEDGADVVTFEKKHAGASYVIVVNNTRSERKTIAHEFCSEPWFRPCGAARRITTRMRLPRGGAVYDFTAGGRRLDLPLEKGEAVLTRDYAAAEGRLYCVYPAALTRLTLSAAGDFAPACRASLVAEVSDARGKPAPGRQLIDLELTGPDGKMRDESGRYVAERGRVSVPLRFSQDEMPGRWRARVRELTSALEAETYFELKEKTR